MNVPIPTEMSAALAVKPGCVQEAPRGWQDDCPATVREVKLRTAPKSYLALHLSLNFRLGGSSADEIHCGHSTTRKSRHLYCTGRSLFIHWCPQFCFCLATLQTL